MNPRPSYNGVVWGSASTVDPYRQQQQQQQQPYQQQHQPQAQYGSYVHQPQHQQQTQSDRASWQQNGHHAGQPPQQQNHGSNYIWATAPHTNTPVFVPPPPPPQNPQPQPPVITHESSQWNTNNDGGWQSQITQQQHSVVVPPQPVQPVSLPVPPPPPPPPTAPRNRWGPPVSTKKKTTQHHQAPINPQPPPPPPTTHHPPLFPPLAGGGPRQSAAHEQKDQNAFSASFPVATTDQHQGRTRFASNSQRPPPHPPSFDPIRRDQPQRPLNATTTNPPPFLGNDQSTRQQTEHDNPFRPSFPEATADQDHFANCNSRPRRDNEQQALANAPPSFLAAAEAPPQDPRHRPPPFPWLDGADDHHDEEQTAGTTEHANNKKNHHNNKNKSSSSSSPQKQKVAAIAAYHLRKRKDKHGHRADRPRANQKHHRRKRKVKNKGIDYSYYQRPPSPSDVIVLDDDDDDEEEKAPIVDKNAQQQAKEQEKQEPRLRGNKTDDDDGDDMSISSEDEEESAAADRNDQQSTTAVQSPMRAEIDALYPDSIIMTMENQPQKRRRPQGARAAIHDNNHRRSPTRAYYDSMDSAAEDVDLVEEEGGAGGGEEGGASSKEEQLLQVKERLRLAQERKKALLLRKKRQQQQQQQQQEEEEADEQQQQAAMAGDFAGAKNDLLLAQTKERLRLAQEKRDRLLKKKQQEQPQDDQAQEEQAEESDPLMDKLSQAKMRLRLAQAKKDKALQLQQHKISDSRSTSPMPLDRSSSPRPPPSSSAEAAAEEAIQKRDELKRKLQEIKTKHAATRQEVLRRSDSNDTEMDDDAQTDLPSLSALQDGGLDSLLISGIGESGPFETVRFPTVFVPPCLVWEEDADVGRVGKDDYEESSVTTIDLHAKDDGDDNNKEDKAIAPMGEERTHTRVPEIQKVAPVRLGQFADADDSGDEETQQAVAAGLGGNVSIKGVTCAGQFDDPDDEPCHEREFVLEKHQDEESGISTVGRLIDGPPEPDRRVGGTNDQDAVLMESSAPSENIVDDIATTPASDELAILKRIFPPNGDTSNYLKSIDVLKRRMELKRKKIELKEQLKMQRLELAAKEHQAGRLTPTNQSLARPYHRMTWTRPGEEEDTMNIDDEGSALPGEREAASRQNSASSDDVEAPFQVPKSIARLNKEELEERRIKAQQRMDITQTKHLVSKQSYLLSVQQNKVAHNEEEIQQCKELIKRKKRELKQERSRFGTLQTRRTVVDGLLHDKAQLLMAKRRELYKLQGPRRDSFTLAFPVRGDDEDQSHSEGDKQEEEHEETTTYNRRDGAATSETGADDLNL